MMMVSERKGRWAHSEQKTKRRVTVTQGLAIDVASSRFAGHSINCHCEENLLCTLGEEGRERIK